MNSQDNQRVALQVQNLFVDYSQREVLRGVSLELVPGEILGILGANGSGKSTLLKTIDGIVVPRFGEIKYNGNDITRLPSYRLARRGIGFLMQGGSTFADLTIREHLEIAAQGVGRKLQAQQIEQVCEIFPRLRRYLDKRAGILSGGERQTVSFAMLTIQESKVWLLDEPTMGLSPESVQMSMNFVRESNESRGTTVLLVEQNWKVASELAHNIAFITEGRMSEKFPRKEFIQKDLFERFIIRKEQNDERHE